MHNFNLKEGYYVVTGGLGLLGKKHCEAISKYGGTPLILDINSSEFNSFSKYLEEKYDKKALFFDNDITNEDSIKNVIDECKKLDLPLLGLINNAARDPKVSNTGLVNTNRLENFTIEEWNKDLSVGLTGAFICTKHFGNFMNNNNGGTIINISSDLGLIAPNQEIYKNDTESFDNQPVKPIS